MFWRTHIDIPWLARRKGAAKCSVLAECVGIISINNNADLETKGIDRR